MKQIGLAINQYVQDYDERMPLSKVFAACTTGGPKTWRSLIFPYTKSTNVFRCPSNKRNRVFATAHDDDATVGQVNVSYGVNYNVINGSTNGSLTDCSYRPNKNNIDQVPLLLSQMNNASSLITIGETLETNPEIVLGRTPNYVDSETGGPFSGHLGMGNFVFADGHAKNMRISATIGPGANEYNNMWLWGNPSTASNSRQPDLYNESSNLNASVSWYRTQIMYVDEHYN